MLIFIGRMVRKDHARAWNLEAAYFKYSQEPVGIINAQISTGKAYKDADSKGSVSMDFGASYHRSMAILDEMASWTIGFRAANLGGKLDGQKLPARLGLGGAVDLPFSMENRLQVALDLNYLLPSEYRHLQAGIGAEYKLLEIRCSPRRIPFRRQ